MRAATVDAGVIDLAALLLAIVAAAVAHMRLGLFALGRAVDALRRLAGGGGRGGGVVGGIV